jgi:hypothetical protein
MDQSGSILDRVISSQQTETLEHFHPVEVVTELLKSLTTKEADILRRRFGLGQQPAETLETIGASYKVTRERVRQIQRWAIDRLRKAEGTKKHLRNVDMLLQQLFEEHGGLMPDDELYAALTAHSAKDAHTHAATAFILEELLADKFTRIESKEYRPYWKPVYVNVPHLPAVIGVATRLLTAAGKPLPGPDLLQQMAAAPQVTDKNLTPLMIQTYLNVSTAVDRNPFGEYGLRSWGSIVPKRMNDKILLVLRKSGKPMHFVEITKRINEIGFDHRQAYPPTVHNELILNSEYVLVGRGIYALKEWGYKPGVVADVIVELIRARGPLDRAAIVDEVLKQRLVKKNTIHLALTNKQRFARMPDGRYALAGTPAAPADRSGQ